MASVRVTRREWRGHLPGRSDCNPASEHNFRTATFWFVFVLLLTGCTTLGIPTREPDMGPAVGVQVCVKGVSPDEAQALLGVAWGGRYGVHLVALCPGMWDVEIRERGWAGSLLSSIFGDVMGAAYPDEGYAWIKGGVPSLQSLLSGGPPAALRHELHHLMGCGHSLVMTDCYRAIANWKRQQHQRVPWTG